MTSVEMTSVTTGISPEAMSPANSALDIKMHDVELTVHSRKCFSTNQELQAQEKDDSWWQRIICLQWLARRSITR
jgi:hypothetical protein